MLWERLFLLAHAKLGLSLLLCTSDAHSWAVTDTSRDVDLCQKCTCRKLSRGFKLYHTRRRPLLMPLNNREERKRSGRCSGNNLECRTHIDARLNEQKHHSELILGLIQKHSIPINTENGTHSCIYYCYRTGNERLSYNTNYHM